jgi:hypothetical protein
VEYLIWDAAATAFLDLIGADAESPAYLADRTNACSSVS